MSGETHRWSVSVTGAFVCEDGKILAIKRRDNGHWEPPGGVLESGEPIYDGLRREVSEETGLQVEPECLSGVYQHLERDIVSLVFRCRVSSGTLREGEETSECRWLTQDEVELQMPPAYATRLIDALQPSQTAIRTHDGSRLR